MHSILETRSEALMDMNIGELYMDRSSDGPARKKRRPALACEQCRRKKIKCDRQTPCQPCVKANIQDCMYVCDSRQTLTTAPFETQDIQFSVFEQSPRRFANASTTINTISNTVFQSQSNNSDFSSLTSLSEQDSLRSPIVDIDQDFTGICDHDQGYSVEPKTDLLGALYPPTNTTSQGFFKLRFYGRSRWMNYVYQSPELLAVLQGHESDKSNHGCATYAGCKAMGKTIRLEESSTTQVFGPFREMVPTRAVSDRLTQAYLRTFQTVFGILYVPSFRENYKAFWNDPSSVTDVFVINLLLVMCIGSTFRSYEMGVSRGTALRWINAASLWSSSSKEKARLSLDGLRIQCLFLLACRCKSVNSGIAWFTMSSLARTAVYIGVHIDAEKHPFSHIPTSEIEPRRRLWATVLELEVQSCMDSGCLPSIESDDYDCALPSNIDDASLEAAGLGGGAIVPKPIDQFTQSSIQILLMKTMSIRLKIARFINSVRAENSFEKALTLSAELSAALKSCNALVEAYRMSSTPPTAFQTNLFDLLVQRFLLGLHHPFAVNAKSKPSYHYSRQLCTETCFSLFSHSTETSDDDFHRLSLCGTGLFHDVHTQSAFYMCGELMDLEADKPFPTNSISARKEMRKSISKFLELAVARIAAGEKKIKCYVLVSCLLAQADAIQTGDSVEQKVSAALKKSLETSYSLLKSKIQGHGVPEVKDVPPPLIFNLPLAINPQQQQQADWSQWDDLTTLTGSESTLWSDVRSCETCGSSCERVF